jgi:uncharacterized membrane protein
MKNKKSAFFLALAMMLLSLTTLVNVWDTTQRWRLTAALTGFIIMFIIFCLSLYVNFIRKPK